MTSHTPGPWTVVGSHGYETEIGAMMGSPDCIIVADTALLHGMPTSRQLADAHLIASAPDLLAALTEARRRIHQCAFEHDVAEQVAGTLTMIDSAIAKARGEAQP